MYCVLFEKGVGGEGDEERKEEREKQSTIIIESKGDNSPLTSSPSIMNHKQGRQKGLESKKPSNSGGIDALGGWGRRRGQPCLLLYNCGPAAGFGHGSSGPLQSDRDKIFDSNLENAVVLWLSPQKEPAAVFGADLLVIV